MRRKTNEQFENAPADLDQKSSFLDLELESVTVREAHHAMHILTFFLFIMGMAEKNQPVRKTLVDRVIYHLLNLREYIQDTHMGDVVTDLSAGISLAYDDFFPANESETCHSYPVVQWLERHESSILELARHYGKESIFQKTTRAA